MKYSKYKIGTHYWFHAEFVFSDPAEVPMCEISLACDNLLCDGHGRPPTPVLEIDVQSKSSKTWIKYARTEVVEVITKSFQKLLPL